MRSRAPAPDPRAHQQPVAGVLDEGSVVFVRGPPRNPVMTVERATPRVVTGSRGLVCRTDDVGEEHRRVEMPLGRARPLSGDELDLEIGEVTPPGFGKPKWSDPAGPRNERRPGSSTPATDRRRSGLPGRRCSARQSPSARRSVTAQSRGPRAAPVLAICAARSDPVADQTAVATHPAHQSQVQTIAPGCTDRRRVGGQFPYLHEVLVSRNQLIDCVGRAIGRQ